MYLSHFFLSMSAVLPSIIFRQSVCLSVTNDSDLAARKHLKCLHYLCMIMAFLYWHCLYIWDISLSRPPIWTHILNPRSINLQTCLFSAGNKILKPIITAFYVRTRQCTLVTRVTPWWVPARESVRPVDNGQEIHQNVNTAPGLHIYVFLQW